MRKMRYVKELETFYEILELVSDQKVFYGFKLLRITFKI